MKRISLKLAMTSMLLLSGPADSFDIEPIPLFLSGQVDPNLILTLDDSGSMGRAYVPERPAATRSIAPIWTTAGPSPRMAAGSTTTRR